METLNTGVIVLLFLAVMGGFSFVIWKIESAHRLEDRLRNRTIGEIYSAMEKLDYHGHVPPVAVERFMSYLKCPDPTFDATAIVRQELNNQRGGPVGSATDDRPFKNSVNP